VSRNFLNLLFTGLIMFLTLGVFSSGVRADTVVLPDTSIIVPGARGELSKFSPEFCGKNEFVDERAVFACVGHAKFHEVITVRVLGLKDRAGTTAFFLESELPGVEILNPTFIVYGPYGGDDAKVTGQVALTRGASGEVNGLNAQVQSWGSVRVSTSSY
jgi:hypothetical protein